MRMGERIARKGEEDGRREELETERRRNKRGKRKGREEREEEEIERRER